MFSAFGGVGHVALSWVSIYLIIAVLRCLRVINTGIALGHETNVIPEKSYSWDFSIHLVPSSLSASPVKSFQIMLLFTVTFELSALL